MNISPVVLITGASRGIGRAIALAFAKNHFRIALNYLQSEEKAKAVAHELQSSGAEVLLLKADVSHSTEVKSMVEKIKNQWNRIDVLVNNAGTTRDRTILKMSDQEWSDVIRTNLSGAFWCLRECGKIMADQKEGTIINIASVVGLRGGIGTANYAASKAGLVALTKSAAREFGRFNVQVHAVLPGFHPTDMTAQITDQQRERVLAEHVLNRFSDLQELGEFLVFLSHQKSISGQVYNFDSRIL